MTRISRHSIIAILLLSFISFFFSCSRSTRTFYHEGVSKELARYRSKQIYDVSYDLTFNIPPDKHEAVSGSVRIHFKPMKARHALIVDFQAGEENLKGILVNGNPAQYYYLNGHIYIDADGFVPRQNNIVEIDFIASDQALNRSDDFMYSLFVPDRASTAFPCFDQPDIKATFQLTLNIPTEWKAMSNGRAISEENNEAGKRVHFDSDKPISTYLFAFTAGNFEVLSETRNGQTINMFHRETDIKKINRNAPLIFDLHFKAIEWLEEYTGIPFPYAKFDMAILPGFQYSGMEHPGAVWYRDARLLLDEKPSITRRISQAGLIAHETAHMWFGNLVTMQWFDDVWLKEVFAGFMADKIIKEQFPEENHHLQFLLSHYPRAFSIDRTRGTHPIKQKLDNMKMAGTLYGPIIYNKAPIIFEQLELIMQPDNFQAAVREYLNRFAHSNADWSDLASIFDKHTNEDISDWSKAWVYGKGLPHIDFRIQSDAPGEHTVIITQKDWGRDFPAQYLDAVFFYEDSLVTQRIWLNQSPLKYVLPEPKNEPLLVLLNGAGLGYGYFELRQQEIDFLFRNIEIIDDEIMRSSAYLNIFENFLNHRLNADVYFDFLLRAISYESNQQLQNYLLAILNIVCSSFLDYEENPGYSQRLEKVIWSKFLESPASARELFFETWMKLSRTSESTKAMRNIYEGKLQIDDFIISDQHMTTLACEAVLRNQENSGLLDMEKGRITNPDRLKRLEFLIPALSHEKIKRDTFFESLKNPSNRNPEPWVLDALYYLHHPLHSRQGMEYILPSLEMLTEIQQTGDIFFPQNWLMAALQHYKGAEVASIVSSFLENNPELPDNLKLKVYQASDILFRSAELTGN